MKAHDMREDEVGLLDDTLSRDGSKTFTKLQDGRTSQLHWARNEKKIWLITLFSGCTVAYAARALMPLCAVKVSEEENWTKTDTGLLLSAFFWGYTASQIVGGYLADRIGGETVMTSSAMVWSVLTALTPVMVLFISSDTRLTLMLLVASRAVIGAFQGVHFPSLSSILAKRVPENEKAFSLSFCCSGSHFGILTCGLIGSLLLENISWQFTFYFFGVLSVAWLLYMRGILMPKQKTKESFQERLDYLSDTKGKKDTSRVPWNKLLRKPAFWAVLIGHFSMNNAWFILLSWLPTYFEESFSSTKGWIFNVVPWIVGLLSTIFSGWFSDKLVEKGFSVTAARKMCEGLGQFGCATFLILLGHTSDFTLAVVLMGLAVACTGFHCGGILVNPMDIAPQYSGSVFGLMNTIGAIPGFLGVYLAGYTLEYTKSWAAVFNQTAVALYIGGSVFVLLGVGHKIL